MWACVLILNQTARAAFKQTALDNCVPELDVARFGKDMTARIKQCTG